MFASGQWHAERDYSIWLDFLSYCASHSRFGWLQLFAPSRHWQMVKSFPNARTSSSFSPMIMGSILLGVTAMPPCILQTLMLSRGRG